MDHRAEYKTSFLAYVDVLGWKRIVEQIGTDFDRLDDILRVYSTLASHAGEDSWIRTLGAEMPALSPPHHLVASDTIILSVPDDGHALFSLVLRCGKICADLLRLGFLTRGAIVRGKLYHQGQVIFGEALTAAYLQEQRSARYPRVLVSPEVIARLEDGGPLKGPWAKSTYGNWFRRDQDGFCRLNLFANLFIPSDETRASHFADAQETIVRALVEHVPGSEEFAKAHWLAEIYNSELQRLVTLEQARAEGIKPIELSVLRDRK